MNRAFFWSVPGRLEAGLGKRLRHPKRCGGSCRCRANRLPTELHGKTALHKSALICTPLVLSLALILTACKLGPDYKRPQVAVPVSYTQTTNGWKVAQPQADLPKGEWWKFFGDPQLDVLELKAAEANQELKAAVARFDQARAYIDISRSGLFPNIALSGSATRQRDSYNRASSGHAAGQSTTFNTFSVPLDLQYELDLWGRARRAIESASAGAQAVRADLESVRLSVQAEVAADYFALRTLDAQLALLRSSVDVFEKSLELTRNRRAGGIATDLDVAQAETILKATQAEIPTTQLERRRIQNALAVLTGEVASSFSLPERPLDLPAVQIPPGIPSELLERRPDIAAAEQRMAAANAAIGVATAAFFPTVRLNGVAGFQSVDAGTLFDWPSRFWAVGPSLTLPIFQGGRLRAELRQSEAAYQETVAQYRQTVLNAFGEVEDNLAAQSLFAQAGVAQVAATEAARKTLEIANNRYRSGLVTYLEVASAQNSALNLEREAVRLRGQQLMSAVALAKSIGGGFPISGEDNKANKE